MTSILERSAKASPAVEHFSHDGEIPPVIETSDGCATGQRINTVVETLAAAAERSGMECDDDGLYRIGDVRDGYIAVGRETDVTQDGTVAHINRLQVVTPSDNKRFFYLGSETEHGMEFRLHEETSGISQSAEFSGSTGDMLSGEAAEISRQLAETLVDVASNKNQQGEISNATLAEVVTPLITPEASHGQLSRRLGGKVVSRFFSKVGRYKAA